MQLLKAAIADAERGLGKFDIQAEEAALKFLSVMSDGDARKALTALEVGVLSQAAHGAKGKIKFNLQLAKDSIQQKTIDYDGTGDTHYDLASALQKSMRGSDPDATVYWLARMIAGGEDTRFIARRIAVCAAEDVGNADPMATVLAAAAKPRTTIAIRMAKSLLRSFSLHVAFLSIMGPSPCESEPALRVWCLLNS
ncbi:hypothetical protein ES703_80853 [subsurface metagenome]